MDRKYEHIIKALAELEEEDFLEGIKEALKSSADPQELVDACAVGVEIVGNYFEEGEYFVGDLVYAANMLSLGMKLIEPLMATGSSKVIGKAVVGTAQGDLHDIGKNIFISMMKAASFEVYDLGVDVSPEQFAAKVREVKPDIVGISGLLTLSIDMMGTIIKKLEEEGLRDLKVMIGGNVANEGARVRTKADAWSTNASKGVKQCKEWVSA